MTRPERRAMRVTKKLRAEAAVLCSAAASRMHRVIEDRRRAIPDGSWQPSPPFALEDLVRELECDPLSGELGEEAEMAAADLMAARHGRRGSVYMPNRETWAEAEALLQTGWTP